MNKKPWYDLFVWGKFCFPASAWGVKWVGRFPSVDLRQHTVRVLRFGGGPGSEFGALVLRTLQSVSWFQIRQSLNLCLFSGISSCTQFLHEGSTGNSSVVILCIAESKLTFQFRLLHRHTSVIGCDWMGLPWQFDSHSTCQEIPPTYYWFRRLLPNLHEPVFLFLPWVG